MPWAHLHNHRIMVENTFHMMYVIIYTMPGLGYLLWIVTKCDHPCLRHQMSLATWNHMFMFFFYWKLGKLISRSIIVKNTMWFIFREAFIINQVSLWVTWGPLSEVTAQLQAEGRTARQAWLARDPESFFPLGWSKSHQHSLRLVDTPVAWIVTASLTAVAHHLGLVPYHGCPAPVSHYNLFTALYIPSRLR